MRFYTRQTLLDAGRALFAYSYRGAGGDYHPGLCSYLAYSRHCGWVFYNPDDAYYLIEKLWPRTTFPVAKFGEHSYVAPTGDNPRRRQFALALYHQINAMLRNNPGGLWL